MPASPNPRWWDGYDDPYGPAASRPQPSHPIPALGAPHIAGPTITTKENPMGYAGNYNERQPLAELVIVPEPTPEPPAEPKPESE
ncbi:hypothetical protein OG689_10865 [Kitasatospora sp. NBC_00240]|uniref:hypothetical protein n=1 Tax=Kitasatospora sp. NBC_00240 TaxID=2903567 RepID=UPI0022504775|nr:hypothetical protein [Kitasatospora sp. NBC_00240]MCX5209785.1 hypothetical protein [Kitasatospora sp. NBC_00240]